MTTISTDFEALRKRLHQLGLFGLLGQDNALLSEPWVESLISIEQNERQRRSLLRRLRDAKLGVFKPLADFDWRWPLRIDRELFTELLGGEFIRDATNVVLVGPNGEREVAMDGYYNNDGIKHINIEPGELMTAVRVPMPDGPRRSAYTK